MFLRKILFILLILGMAVPAMAKVMDFPSIKAKIEVPDNWTATEDPATLTVQLIANDKSASMTLAKFPAEGGTVEALAKELSKMHKGTEPKEIESGMYSYTFTLNDVETNVIVSVDKDICVLISMTGDPTDMHQILNNITDY